MTTESMENPEDYGLMIRIDKWFYQDHQMEAKDTKINSIFAYKQ